MSGCRDRVPPPARSPGWSAPPSVWPPPGSRRAWSASGCWSAGSRTTPPTGTPTRSSASSATTRRTGWRCRTAPTSTWRWSSRPARWPGTRRWCSCTGSAWTWARSTSSASARRARRLSGGRVRPAGHGRSGRLESGEYDLTALGHTLRRVLDEVAPEGPLVLVGHSMGGMTIMALAELYPEMFGDRVVGTVLMATSGGLAAETKLVAPALLGRVGSPVLYMMSNATRYGGTVIDRARRSTSNVAWLLTRKYGFGTSKPSPALVSYVEMMNSRTSADTVTRYLRTIATHSRFPALAALAGTPVLVIVGTRT
ncbi:alpha/beta fold hydrolase [Micromonospora sp. BRA006-A]|nr:alpha/beta fold hydrolase [Micromonospora sp. BRA006-A]